MSADTILVLSDSMRRHWRSGLRPPEFQHAVRADVPNATLAEFNQAADETWRKIGGEP